MVSHTIEIGKNILWIEKDITLLMSNVSFTYERKKYFV
jgi:hypothetical protein